MVGTIDKRTPHHLASERIQCLGKHIGPLGMRAPIVTGTRLSLRIGLDKKTSEIRYHPVYLGNFCPPPLTDLWVERISRSQTTKFHGCGKIYRQIYTDIIGTEHIGHPSYLIYISGRKHLRRCVDIVQNSCIDAHRRIGACILYDAVHQRSLCCRKTPAVSSGGICHLLPLPHAISCITTLDTSVEIVPMVEHTDSETRMTLHIKRHAQRLTAQSLVGTVNQPGRTTGCNSKPAITFFDSETVVIGHSLVYTQHSGLATISGGQFLACHGNTVLNTFQFYLSLADILPTQPQGATVFRT